jgi:hypothetical protein
MIHRFCTVLTVTAVLGLLNVTAVARGEEKFEYRVLATKKTSTMEKEMNEAADSGYRFAAVMGGETAFGGSEVVVVMQRSLESGSAGRYQYKLLATNKTSTMEKELQQAADEGFQYCGQTVFKSTFGGDEVAIIVERDSEDESGAVFKFKLLGTNKTSTMEKELREAGDAGFELLGLTVGQTAFGGAELISIMRKRVSD